MTVRTRGRFLIILTVTLAGFAVVAFLVLRQKMAVNRQPITVRCVRSGEITDKGYLTFGAVFSATIHTGNSVVVSLLSVEVKNGSNWIVQPSVVRGVQFQPPDKSWGSTLMDPHEAGKATIELTNLPAKGIWRARFIANETLSGVEDISARVRTYPDLLERRIRGNTTLPVNPFSKRRLLFGPPVEVVSQEVSED